jgi:hypothetical protein
MLVETGREERAVERSGRRPPESNADGCYRGQAMRHTVGLAPFDARDLAWDPVSAIGVSAIGALIVLGVCRPKAALDPAMVTPVGRLPGPIIGPTQRRLGVVPLLPAVDDAIEHRSTQHKPRMLASFTGTGN